VKWALVLAMLAVCGSVRADQWKLPVFTLRSEVSQGVEEDEEEGVLEPSYTRYTVSLRAKEELGRRFRATLALRYSTKDFDDAGEHDYWYFSAAPGLEWSLGQLAGFGVEFLVKSAEFEGAYADGLSRDYLDVGSKLFADWNLRRGLKLDAWLRSTYSLYENETRNRQGYTFAVGLTGRWGQWSVGARYRGTARFPIGSGVEQQIGGYHTGSVNVSWDPNK
jgi:hypothetical protein